MNITKLCQDCKKSKPLSDYVIGKYGSSKVCKKCQTSKGNAIVASKITEGTLCQTEYLIRDKGNVKAAHIWNGSDTLCRMWSTGGMNKSYGIYKTPEGHEICQMCKNVMGSK